mmetsp:Transcript_145747/g.467032  ORF Transcript_145747/g.467032 Transcript_145747/m.467032 type:complete len:237 (+) Transcript_145747:129-839(+)
MRRPRGSHAAAGGATAELSVSASSAALGGDISSTGCSRRCVGRALGAAVRGMRWRHGRAPDASDAGVAVACRWESPAEAVVEPPSQVEGATSKSIGMETSRQNSSSDSSSPSGPAVGTAKCAVRCAVADGPFSDPSLGSARATAGVTGTGGQSGKVWSCSLCPCSSACRAKTCATRSRKGTATMLTEGLSQPEPELAEGQVPVGRSCCGCCNSSCRARNCCARNCCECRSGCWCCW